MMVYLTILFTVGALTTTSASLYFAIVGCGGNYFGKYYGLNAVSGSKLNFCIQTSLSSSISYAESTVTVSNYLNLGYNAMAVQVYTYTNSACTGVSTSSLQYLPNSCSAAAQKAGLYVYGQYYVALPNVGLSSSSTLIKHYTGANCGTIYGFDYGPSKTCLANAVYSCTNTTISATQYSNNGCTGTFSTIPIAKTGVCEDSNEKYFIGECLAPSSNTVAISTCFSSDALVDKENEGSVPISSVQIGDRILSVTKQGDFKYADVVSVPHSANLIEASFLTLSTTAGDIRLTPEHLLMVARECGSVAPQLRRADDVAVGFCLMTAAGPAPVTAVAVTRGRGVYTIVTNEELIVVNGFIASPFALNHAAAHSFYHIHRILFHFAPDSMKIMSEKSFLGVFGALLGITI